MAKKETERDRLMQDAQQAAGGNYKQQNWFRNVFLYYYLKYILIGIVAIGLIAYIIYDSVNRVEPDFTLTIASHRYFEDEELAEFRALLEDEVGDANNDGKVEVEVYTYMIVSDSVDSISTASAMIQAFDASFVANSSNVLYLMHSNFVDRFDRATTYEKLSTYGLQGEDEYAVYANKYPVMQRFLGDMSDYYFIIKGMPDSRRDNPEYIHNYDLAVRVLNRIIATD